MQQSVFEYNQPPRSKLIKTPAIDLVHTSRREGWEMGEERSGQIARKIALPGTAPNSVVKKIVIEMK